jgi:hypothetical protein
MGLYVRVQKVSDDGKLVRYSFTDGEKPERMLIVDRDEECLWPEDGNPDGIYRGAAQALVRDWRKKGELPDKALLQA